MMKLMRGGKIARCEAELMVREKIDAALEATTSLMAGASGDKNSPSVSKTCCGECEAVEQVQFGSEPKEKTTSKVVFWE